MGTTNKMTDFATLKAVASLIPIGSRVLDLGCGDGVLLDYLIKNRACHGYGIEIDDANVLACVKRGVNVIQLNLDEGLTVFEDNSFDVVLQIDTLQHLRNTAIVLRETARVGLSGIVAFPNFGYWLNRWSILIGHMPVTKRLPYEWYDTPNIRVGTHNDLLELARINKLNILESFGLHNGARVDFAPNLLASTSVLKFSR
jgi:methionine biosynthesis protein MetW